MVSFQKEKGMNLEERVSVIRMKIDKFKKDYPDIIGIAPNNNSVLFSPGWNWDKAQQLMAEYEKNKKETTN